MKNILLISALLMSFNALSADVNFNWLKSTSNQNSSLSGTCEYVNSSNDMDCNLRQISVRKKTDMEDANKTISEATLELDSKLKDKGIKGYVKEMLGETCEKIPLSDEVISSLGTDREGYDAIVDICNAPTRDKILNFLTLAVKNDVETCKVFDYDIGNFLFNKVSEKKWVSTNKPSGQCAVITILTLEQHPEHNTLWNYSQIKHYTNTESEFCKSLSVMYEPMSYSWKGRSSLKMDCKFIEFGM
jgi:hypothetical protein